MPGIPSSPPEPTPRRSESHGKVPGGFDDDEHDFTAQQSYRGQHASLEREPSGAGDSSILPPLPEGDSSLHAATDDGGSRIEHDDMSAMNEREMQRKLMEVESSFLPALSPVVTHEGGGADDTFLVGAPRGPDVHRDGARKENDPSRDDVDPGDASILTQSPPTPPESYKTPYPQNDETPTRRKGEGAGDEEVGETTSSLETMSSSPTAAAAARTVSRAVSMATIAGYETGGYETAGYETAGYETADDRERSARTDDEEETPRKPRRTVSSQSMGPGGEPPKLQYAKPSTRTGDKEKDAEPHTHLTSSRRRPKYLQSRHASQRSSTSSYTTRSDISTDAPSDATLGADFALQSGGAAPANSSIVRPRQELSRSISLGSIASGVSAFSDSVGRWNPTRTMSGTSAIASLPVEGNLEPLDEERGSPSQSSSREKPNHTDDDHSPSPPATPKARGRTLTAPTDTAMADHIRRIHVPPSVRREYSEKNRLSSPDKKSSTLSSAPGRANKNMTLKEQSSTIDRLTKENFDLKLKIHYLNSALNERSEEGVKQMISENVELKAGLVTVQREARNLRRTIRDLERKLQEREEGLAAAAATSGESDEEKSEQSFRQAELEEEVVYLKDRVETYELEIEKLRSESVGRENEKRRLAEVVRSMGERTSRGVDADIGAREEMDMWKDMYETENARREQADEDNRKLREEIWRLKNDGSSTTTNNFASNMYHVSKQQRASFSQARSSSSENAEKNASLSSASTLVEQLRHENAELRREVGAQTSMLTSRNKERERLYQEIEDLKLKERRGDAARSVAGDSILERSASRALQRPGSRMSNMTKTTQMSDAEREDLENKNDALRDQISGLKLKNQQLDRNLEDCLDQLDQADALKADLTKTIEAYEEEMNLATQDLQAIQAERDEALAQREEKEADYEGLKAEAQQTIDGLEEELEHKDADLAHLEVELENRIENFRALQGEMRLMSESLLRLEDDQQANTRKIQSLEQELGDANVELESLEKSLVEANTKVERLTVQQESSQSEISFLREEQEGDKIKIGDLETVIKTTEINLREERGKAKELEERLAEERHQHEVLVSQEKQEVQRMIDDLNREATAAKDESRRLRKSLSSREVEATTWKERLMELENNLREALGDLNGTRSSLLSVRSPSSQSITQLADIVCKSITRLQKELDTTVSELDITKNNLADKERLLKNRDSLLESSGLESRKLSELLEKERQARRAERHQYDSVQRAHQQSIMTNSRHETRLMELETARQHDRKKWVGTEQQYKEQLSERNNLLLSLWNRLSALCGTDWAHKYSLVNGKLPSLEVVATALPGFSKNLVLAVKTIEGLLGGFKTRIRNVETQLWKEYQTLEHALDVRSKKLDSLESTVQLGALGSAPSPELAKLRAENKTLKAELKYFQKQPILRSSSGGGGGGGHKDHGRESNSKPSSSSSSHSHSRELLSRGTSSRGDGIKDSKLPGPIPSDRRSSLTAAFSRHHSASAVEQLERNISSTITHHTPVQSQPIEPSHQRWIYRLKELERRLKAEREGRLLDRTGARKRLEEERVEYELLRRELERERDKRISEGGAGTDDGGEGEGEGEGDGEEREGSLGTSAELDR
ncbi:MAG: hypothetical protein M1819_000546 [Sarea resinae]|nr:MAG: hypothetical protein M1819_000546 [Sarea resinae]